MFAGDGDDYHHPRNSLLHEVLARRVGMPITLSVVAIEVGRRLGVPIRGVGLPGHFVIRDKQSGTFADPFGARCALRRGGDDRVVEATDGQTTPRSGHRC